MTDAQARARVWTLCRAALVLAALTGPVAALLTPLAHDPSPALTIVAAVLAAAFAAGLIYLWLEVLFRLLFTYTSLASRYTLWNGRAGNVAAMWLTISAVALVAFVVLGFGVFRGRAHIGTIPVWTILLIVSAIVAPLIGEIGTPLGI